MAEWQRTHTCGELRDTHIGQTVTLNGWVNTYRSYNNQVFVDLRDRYGVTQVVFEAGDTDLFRVAEGLRSEFVLSVTGTVAGVQYSPDAFSTLKRRAEGTGTLAPLIVKPKPLNAEASNGRGVSTPSPVASSMGWFRLRPMAAPQKVP